MTRRISVEPFAPGEYLQDYIDGKGWTQDDLAEVIGRSRAHVNRLIAGTTAITPQTAVELGKAFGTSAELWMNLQTSYELSVAAQEERGIAKRAVIYDKVPVRDIAKRGWIKKPEDVEELERAVCRLLQIDTIASDPPFANAIAARKSTEYGVDTPAQMAWYARACQLANYVGAAEYRDDRFEELLIALRALALHPADVRRVPPLLSQFGIRLVLIEVLPKSKIDGAAIWLEENKPAIALSLRYDRIDNFWFTLAHELMHIKHRDKAPIDVDIACGPKDTDSVIEVRANKEAAEYLVSQEKLESFIIRCKPYYYQAKVIQFAQARAVHPGIVVGQLHHRKELDFTHLKKLQAKIRADIVGQAVTDGWGNQPAIQA